MAVVERFRQPEYTGENRCTPCTLANIAIAAGLAAAVGWLWRPAGGLAVFAVSLASIWLRGYLVPGTPELTKRYFPDRVLAWFDKGPEPVAQGGHADGEPPRDVTDVDPETVLSRGGVVEPCEREDDLCLADGFRGAWRDRIAALRDGGAEREELAEQLDLDPEDVSFEEHETGFVAYHDGARVGQWESRAALLADLAAAQVLPDWLTDWQDLPVGARSQVLGGLRIFLDDCPECGGAVAAGTETVESCCRSHEVVAASCSDCDARLLEVPYREEAAA